MSGGSSAGTVRGLPRTHRRRLGRGARDRGATPNLLSQARAGRIHPRAQLGRTPPVPAHPGGRGRVLKALAGKCRRRPLGGRFPDSGGLGATAGPAGQTIGDLPAAGATWVAKGGARHTTSQAPTRGSGGRERKLPEVLETLLTPEVVKGRHVRLMLQDEARFGRRVRIRRCWAPAPQRPVVDNGSAREFQYVYGAVSPLEGELTG